MDGQSLMWASLMRSDVMPDDPDSDRRTFCPRHQHHRYPLSQCTGAFLLNSSAIISCHRRPHHHHQQLSTMSLSISSSASVLVHRHFRHLMVSQNLHHRRCHRSHCHHLCPCAVIFLRTATTLASQRSKHLAQSCIASLVLE